MTRATYRYNFELKILDWGFGQMRHLYDLPSGTFEPFFLTFNTDGDLASTLLSDVHSTFIAAVHEIRSDPSQRWFFFDPFDAPEHTYIAWSGLSQSHMQTLIGVPFTDPDDFIQMHLVDPDQNPNNAEHSPTEFPETHGVMF